MTSQEIREPWGDIETVSVKVTKRGLEWLGHVARMPDHRIPKQTLFGWLPESCPQGGPRRRWRDLIRRDLKTIEVEEELWYSEATTSRAGWRATYQLAMEDWAVKQHQRRKLVTPRRPATSKVWCLQKII